ncbi:hypothetical protein V5799_031578 [Amblyomma americanum]|uniref:Uncharacterized protein n=1 Tax=Amblyomma americanum TaxID=6943 RepID=A0AAQ4DTN2_AMBAM
MRASSLLHLSEDGSTKDFECAYPILGRFVYIHMVGGEGSLSLCEVMVFTTQEFSPDRCGNQVEPLELTTFIRKCYEFQGSRGGSFQDAASYCQTRGGLLVHSVDDLTLPFISAELERRRDKLKSKLVWMGAQRRTGIGAGKRGWFWVSGEPVRDFLWAEDQPNNYNGQQNCVVIDGGRKWRWNDVTCDLDYLPWICQYNPSNCGSPDRQENSTATGKDYRVGQEVSYECPTGSLLVGSVSRKCAASGFWTGSAPSCKYMDCGTPDPVDNGRVVLLHGRTTYNATVEYVCDTNYTLVGHPRRLCGTEGRWNGTKPSCLQSYCPLLSPVPSSSLDVQGRRFGDRAHYKCDSGHKLIGNDTRYCELGGTWSGDDPTCKFIDCGEPRPLEDGDVYLVNGTSTFLSVARYTCGDNFTLSGVETRTCLETGFWSDVEPTCDIVDCGRVPPILKGEVSYENGSTYLGSQIAHWCSAGYRLNGVRVRTCGLDGRWNGTPPKCEEIRCPPPEIPKNATVVYGGNDRSSAESFKIGSTVQYRCVSGHIVQGESLRTCQATGRWTAEVPQCVLVDCGNPSVISNGRGLLVNGTTTFESVVEYECLHDFKLIGEPIRTCQEDGHWSGREPRCTDIPMIGTNDIEGADSNRADFTYDSSRTVGIAIAVGAGALLVIAIVVAIVWMRTKAQRVKNTENIEVNRSLEKDNATVMSFSRLALEAAEANSTPYSNGPGIRHNPNGLVTFAAGPQPIYANVTVNGQNLSAPNASAVARVNLGAPPSPPHAPPRHNNNNNTSTANHHAHQAYGNNRGAPVGNGHHMSSTLQSHDV